MQKVKLLLAIASAVSVLLVSAHSFALDVPATKTIMASVTPIPSPSTWDAVLKNISDNNAATAIGWSNVIAGMDSYKVADQYIEVTVDITNPGLNWRMIIYTNNTHYTGNTSLGEYGLVNVKDNEKGLPLAWRAQEDLETPDTPEFSTTRPQPNPTGFTDYMWKFVVDKTRTGTYAWDATSTYVRVWDNAGFYWHENGDGITDLDPVKDGAQVCPAPSIDDKVFIYFGAGFAHSLSQEYSTESLTLEILVL